MTRKTLGGPATPVDIINLTVDTDPKIRHAINEVFSTYGDVVSVEAKKKSLNKYGENTAVGTAETEYTLWATGQDEANETYILDNTNGIDSISSEAAGDTMQIRIEGHTDNGTGNLTFIVQTVTLLGLTRVPLPTPLNRVSRAFVFSGTVSTVGDIFIYENTSLTAGKPTDTTKIHLTIHATKNQSHKMATSISANSYWFVTEYGASYPEKGGTNIADIEIQLRPIGGVWLHGADLAIQQGGTVPRVQNPYLIIPKNHDVRLVAVTSANSQNVNGYMNGYLALIIG